MNTNYKNEDQARAEIAQLQKRKEELVIEASQLKEAISASKSEIASLIFLRKNVDRQTEQIARDADHLASMTDAIKIADREIEAAHAFIGQQYRAQFEQKRREFLQGFVSIGDDLRTEQTQFFSLKKVYDELLDLCGRAFITRQEAAFPHIEISLQQTLEFYFGPAGILADFDRIESNHSALFKEARQAKKPKEQA